MEELVVFGVGNDGAGKYVVSPVVVVDDLSEFWQELSGLFFGKVFELFQVFEPLSGFGDEFLFLVG